MFRCPTIGYIETVEVASLSLNNGDHRMSKTIRLISLLTLLMVLATMLAPLGASASTKGRRNTAIGLTGAAAYALLRHKTAAGVVIGAGAAYAWKRHHDATKADARTRAYRARRAAAASRAHRAALRTASLHKKHVASKHYKSVNHI